jgi:carboxymethylenebutenolidase
MRRSINAHPKGVAEMTQRVTYPTSSGDDAMGLMELPDGGDKAPAVVVIQEWWGLNDQLRSIARRWAKEGFIALMPDLFHGEVVKIPDSATASAKMAALDKKRALDECVAAVEFLRNHTRTTGRVAVTGYCMGGALAFATACAAKDLAAVVPFYGLPDPSADLMKVTAPIQAHFAQHDQWATVDGAQKIQSVLRKNHKTMELHVYEAQHAFCNDQRPDVYDRTAAEHAWTRALAFVRQHAS